MTRTQHKTAFLLTMALCALVLPFAANAQAANDLSATIRAQLLSDPRTATLSQTQFDAMVQLLSQEVQKRGLTTEDLTWRPQPAQYTFGSMSPAAPAVEQCDTIACLASEAFGFSGPDTLIAFVLGATSMGLVWILAEMLHRRRYSHSPVPSVPSTGL